MNVSNHQAGGWQPAWSAPQPARKPWSPLAWVIVGVAVVIGLCGVFAFIGMMLPDQGPVAPLAPGRTSSPESLIGPGPKPSVSQAIGPAPVTATPNQVKIEDGLWHVGEDVQSGTYRLEDPVTGSDFCYWSKTRDAEGSDIIDNGLGSTGRLQVTLKSGQWFKSERCGTWIRK